MQQTDDMPLEEVVIRSTGVHWAVYLRAGLCALSGAAILAYAGIEAAAAVVGLVLLLMAMIFLFQAAIARKSTQLVLTDRRIIVKFGFLRRWSVETRLARIEEIHVGQTLLGRLLGYGWIAVRAAGGGWTPVPFVADPVSFRNDLAALLD